MILPLLMTAALLAPDDEAVARIGDRDLTAAEYGQWLVEQHGYVFLDAYVLEQLLLLEADRVGVMPTDDDVERAYEEEVQSMVDRFFNGDREAWYQAQVRKGNDPAEVGPRRKHELKIMLCMNGIALRDRVVTEEQIQERYQAIYGDLEEKVTVEVLFFDLYSGMADDAARPELSVLDQRTRNRADAARGRLLEGAAIRSLLPLSDPVDSEFVSVGQVDTWRRDLLGPEVDLAISRLDDAGDVAPLVKVWNGYWAVRLVERRVVTLEDVREELLSDLLQQPVTGAEQSVLRERLAETYAPDKLIPGS
jgi:hypothetical protein